MLLRGELVEADGGGYYTVTIHLTEGKDAWCNIPGKGKCIVQKDEFAWKIVKVEEDRSERCQRK